MSWCWGTGTSVICWRITPPTTTGCVRTLRSTRMLRSIAQTVGRIASVTWLGGLHRQLRSDGIIGRHRYAHETDDRQLPQSRDQGSKRFLSRDSPQASVLQAGITPSDAGIA